MPDPKARGAFDRERRRRALARLSSRLRMEPDDVSHMLPFDEVVAALGLEGQVDRGLQTIRLDSIVGTVDRSREGFDRQFRPTTGQIRDRWERIATARREGEPLPPIDVYRIRDLHFVNDGHHRVSVARSRGEQTIQAHVIEVVTAVDAGRELRPSDLPLKRHERVFNERVPLPPAARNRIRLSNEWRYAQLASLIEAWGYRASQDCAKLLTREQLALAWFHEEYEPVVDLLNGEAFGGPGTDAERYLRIAMLRFLLLTTHEWSEAVIERLISEIHRPAAREDTLVHQILAEME